MKSELCPGPRALRALTSLLLWPVPRCRPCHTPQRTLFPILTRAKFLGTCRSRRPLSLEVTDPVSSRGHLNPVSRCPHTILYSLHGAYRHRSRTGARSVWVSLLTPTSLPHRHVQTCDLPTTAWNTTGAQQSSETASRMSKHGNESH